MADTEAIVKLKKWIEENGYKTGSFKKFDTVKGIPGGAGVQVAPEWSPVDGDHTIKVTPTEVFQLTIRTPWGYNEWLVYSHETYSSPAELKKILDGMIKQPTGCW